MRDPSKSYILACVGMLESMTYPDCQRNCHVFCVMIMILMTVIESEGRIANIIRYFDEVSDSLSDCKRGL